MNSKQLFSSLLLALSLHLVLSGVTLAAPWTSAPSLNVARQFFGADVDSSGNIWVAGGWNRTSGCGASAGPVLDSVEVLWFDGMNYAPSWELTSIVMPVQRRIHTIVIADGYIYVLGGLSTQPGGCPPIATVDRYDIQADTWDSNAVPDLPVPSFDASAIVDGLGRIWYMGGQSDCSGAFTNRVDIFDPAQPQLGWQPGPPLNTARARFGAVLKDGSTIYAIGGYSDAGHIQSVERINSCVDSTWQTLPESLPGPTTNDDQAVIGSDGDIYVIGGWVAHNFTNRVVRRDSTTGLWTSENSLITARSGHRIVLGHDDNIYALAGSIAGCNSSVDVERMPTPATYGGFSECNSNGIPDECESDCNTNGIPDGCDIAGGTSEDVNTNDVPDECEPVFVLMDIKPGSCPNPLNRRSHGVLPVALVGTIDFDPTTIDLTSVLISRADGVGGSVAPHEGPPGPHSTYEDAAAPFEGDTCDCHDAGEDGVTDLLLKFKVDELADVLQLDTLQPGDSLQLVVTGNLLDGTPFTVSDCVEIVGPAAPPGLISVRSNMGGNWIDVNLLDEQLDGGGFDEFARTYEFGTTVRLTAPAVSNGRPLVEWNVDGVAYEPNGGTFDVFIESGSTTVKAVYRPLTLPDRELIEWARTPRLAPDPTVNDR